MTTEKWVKGLRLSYRKEIQRSIKEIKKHVMTSQRNTN